MKRFIKAALCLALCLMVAQGFTVPAQAVGTNRAIQLGAAVLGSGRNTDNAATVYFGADANGSPYAWRVIGYDGEGTAAQSGAATLFSSGNLDTTKFHNTNNVNAYQTSQLKQKLEAVASRLSAGETAAVRTRTLVSGEYNGLETDCIAGPEVANAKMWPLSIKEAYALSQNLRIVPEASWWTRSPSDPNYTPVVKYGPEDWMVLDPYNGTKIMSSEGILYNCYVNVASGVRPAFYLSLDKVLLVSAVDGGQPAVSAGEPAEIGAYYGSAWKLTLLDTAGHGGFAVSQSSVTASWGGSITLNYSGAATGTNEYVTVLLCDSTGPVYRVSSAALTKASGSLSFTLPSSVMVGSYTLKVFNEQRNGDRKTDYASAFKSIPLTVTHTHSFTYTLSEDGTTITASCGGDCWLPEHQAALTLHAPAKTELNDGLSAEATVSGNSDALGTPATVYKRGSTVLSAAPTAVGDYTASITLGGKTAKVSYSIAAYHFMQEGDTYIIHTATGWERFCSALSTDSYKAFAGKTVKLDADISVTSSARRTFKGTFDGQGHTLRYTSNAGFQNNAPFYAIGTGAVIRSLNVVCDITTSQFYSAGLVSNCSGTVRIENCSVSGTIATSGKYAAGFVSYLTGSLTLENCRSSVTISSSVAGEGTHAGFIAYKPGPGGESTIRGCVFDGRLLSSAGTTSCGGFLGWDQGGSSGIIDSIFAPAALSVGPDGCENFTRGRSTGIINSYFLTAFPGSTQGRAPHGVTAGDDVTLPAVSPVGEATRTYSVSGITAYENGLSRGGTFYYGSGDEVSLPLSHSEREGYTFLGYETDAGTLEGDILTMPDGDVTVSARYQADLSYIQADGSTAVRTGDQYTLLTGGGAVTLPGGWYAVEGSVSYTDTLAFTGDTHLLLSEGAELTVSSNNRPFLVTDGSLTIYGQDDSSGTLRVNGNSTYGCILVSDGDITINSGEVITGGGTATDCANLTINGGRVQSDGIFHALKASSSITINGGGVIVLALGDAVNAPSITVNGGRVRAIGYMNGTNRITLGWTSPDDNITCRIRTSSSVPITIADGQILTDGKNAYSGTLDEDQLEALKAQKSLVPAWSIAVPEEAHGTVTPDRLFAAEGQKVTLNVETDPGYTLSAVTCTPAGGTAQTVSLNDSGAFTFNMPTADVTVEAQWTANTYTVHFDKNYEPVEGTMADMSFTYDQPQHLNALTFRNTIPGDFLGWNTQADGSGTAYENQAEVSNLTAQANGSVTLYAQWQTKYPVMDMGGLFNLYDAEGHVLGWAQEGDTVRVEAIDNTQTYTITVTADDGTDIPFDESTSTFTMPGQVVWLTSSATFTKLDYFTDIYLDEWDYWEDVSYLYDAEHPTVTPAVKVEYIGEELTEGTDYTLSITNNTGRADSMVEAAVTVTGKGHYIGTVSKTFRITPFDISNCTIRGTLEAYDDGYGVHYPLSRSAQVWNGNTRLVFDTDYVLDLVVPESVVDYSEYFTAGDTEYEAVVSGRGQWCGTKAFTFRVINLYHTVVYDPNGGTGSMESFQAHGGESYKLPVCGFEAPLGQKFKQWKVSSDERATYPGQYYATPYIYDESYIDTITVQAIWEDKGEYSITASGLEHGALTVNGQTVALENGQATVLEGDLITVVPQPGYRLLSVSVMNAYSQAEAVENDSFTMPTVNVTLTAVLEALPTSAVSFAAGGGSGAMDPVTVITSTPYTLPPCGLTAPTGKAFAGWLAGQSTDPMAPGESLTVNDDLTLTAAWTPLDYALTLFADHGTATAPASAHYGDTVSVTVATDTGYVFDSLTGTTASGGSVQISSDLSFAMPAEDVTLTAVFTPIDYAITASGFAHGSLWINGEQAADLSSAVTAHIGDTVTVSPDEDYHIGSLLVADADGGNVEISEDGTFAMPAGNVTVAASFFRWYQVIVDDNLTGGTVTACTAGGSTVTRAVAGDAINLRITPDEEYHVSSCLVTDADGNEVEVNPETDAFTMPESDVTVTAIFLKTPEANVNGPISLTYTGAAQTLVSGTTTGGTLWYAVCDSYDRPRPDAWSTQVPSATAVGTYYVWYRVAGNAEYEDLTPQMTVVEIARRTVTIKAGDASKRYDGTPLTESSFTVTGLAETDTHVFTVTMTEASICTEPRKDWPNEIGTIDGLDIINLRAQAGQSADAPVPVGSYVVYTQAGTLTVTLEPEVTAPAARYPIYSGSLQLLAEAGTVTGGEMQYALGTDAAAAPTSGWSTAVPAATDVGTYYVWYRVIGDSTHSDTEAAVITAWIAEPFGQADFLLPTAMKAVQAEAFEGIAASVIEIPSRCRSIGDHAFRSCPNLTQIKIPQNCQLGTGVFDGCGLVYVYGYTGSDAEAYCSDPAHDNCRFVPLD
ncbi:MAG: InlB B-repeat-containing protein [Clostridia bacterium]|nr:InlB B-repeat-containing protein [Clostridia bacterium]